MAERPPRQRDSLVGRARELDVLEQVLDTLEGDPHRAIELVGEPGIGKTRLLSELASGAERRGHLVLSGSASELERELPFSVFVVLIASSVSRLSGHNCPPSSLYARAQAAP